MESPPFAMVSGLRRHNRAHPRPEQSRLRMALHAGEVRYDEHGVTGASVNLAFRLLEAGPLKQALAGSPGPLAVIVSPWFSTKWHATRLGRASITARTWP